MKSLDEKIDWEKVFTYIFKQQKRGMIDGVYKVYLEPDDLPFTFDMKLGRWYLKEEVL